MKYCVLYILLFTVNLGLAQQKSMLRLKVIDAKTKQGIAYCNIVQKGTQYGTISNSDGNFVISINDSNQDTLVFSHIGYKMRLISTSELTSVKSISLQKKQNLLNAVPVFANNDYLYDAIYDCRKFLKKNKSRIKSKVYYAVESSSNNKPIELLECYYNGQLNGEEIESLEYKNGRTALATSDGNYFQTYNTAKALTKIKLVDQNGYFPGVPTQLTKKKLRKNYKLELASVDSFIYHIRFTPKDTNEELFSGEIWIDKLSKRILKIQLTKENSKQHPFLPIHSSDAVYNVNFNITQTFTNYKNSTFLDHTQFSYNFSYHSVRNSSNNIPSEKQKNIIRNIESNGIIEYYSYQKPFFIPFFNYAENLYYGDYYRMTFIPYNNMFWEYNQQMVLTERQNKNLSSIANRGQLINYYDENFVNPSLNQEDATQFAFFYAFWTPKKRVVLNRKLPQNKPFEQKTISNSFQSDLYKFKTQILLDISQIGDSLHTRTYTVFDSYQSFYHLQETDCTIVVMNLYFDICEIERRKLDSLLHSKAWELHEVDSLYKMAVSEMEKITTRFLKEVKLGLRKKELYKWNLYVSDRLNIDNVAMMEATLKHQKKHSN